MRRKLITNFLQIQKVFPSLSNWTVFYFFIFDSADSIIVCIFMIVILYFENITMSICNYRDVILTTTEIIKPYIPYDDPMIFSVFLYIFDDYIFSNVSFF